MKKQIIQNNIEMIKYGRLIKGIAEIVKTSTGDNTSSFLDLDCSEDITKEIKIVSKNRENDFRNKNTYRKSSTIYCSHLSRKC